MSFLVSKGLAVSATAPTTKGSNSLDEGTTPNSGTVLQAIKTTYEACWFSDIGTSYTSDTALVQENGTIMVSDVFDDAYIAGRETVKTGNTSSSARTSNFYTA